MKKILLAVILLNSMVVKSQIQAIFTPSQTHNAVISYPYANINSEATPLDMVAAYWTGNATQGAWRSFFKVDLSSIAPSAVIDSAFFTFYANTSSVYGNVGKPNFGVQNAAYICRVTSAWNTNQFNWNNQPSFTTINAAVLDQSISDVQDYLHIDATDLIKDIIAGTNNGFAFLLQNEMSYYDSQIFHSSSSADNSKKPKLTIYYRFPASVSDKNDEGNDFTYIVKSSNLILDFKKEFTGSISIFNTLGMRIKKETMSSQKNISLSTLECSSGIYFVEIKGEKFREVIKIAL